MTFLKYSFIRISGDLVSFGDTFFKVKDTKNMNILINTDQKLFNKNKIFAKFSEFRYYGQTFHNFQIKKKIINLLISHLLVYNKLEK